LPEANWWIHKLDQLSLEQLNDCIKDFGPAAPLTRERDAKLLMAQVNGLSRSLALDLVKPHPDWWKNEPAKFVIPFGLCTQLREVFRVNTLTRAEIRALEDYCSDDGLRLLHKVRDQYLDDPTTKAVKLTAEEALRSSYIEMEAAEAEGGEWSSEDVAESMERRISEADEAVRMRQQLADEFGITSPADYRLYIAAIKCTAKRYPQLLRTPEISAHNALMKKADNLYKRAVHNRCSPQALIDWDNLVNSGEIKKHPNVIYRRPNGTLVWGGAVQYGVMYDKDGNPKRPMQTIFGQIKPQGSVPYDLDQLVEKAFKDDEDDAT
jgi:integrase